MGRERERETEREDNKTQHVKLRKKNSDRREKGKSEKNSDPKSASGKIVIVLEEEQLVSRKIARKKLRPEKK